MGRAKIGQIARSDVERALDRVGGSCELFVSPQCVPACKVVVANVRRSLRAFMSGLGGSRLSEIPAAVDTRLPCTATNLRTASTIAREMVRTACTDRVPECVKGAVLVRAQCPTKGASDRFEGGVRKFARLVSKAKAARR